MKRKPFFYLIYGFAALLLSVLIGAEIYLRINYKDRLPAGSKRPLVYEADSLAGYRYIPGSVFEINDQVVKINELGFIGEELPPKSPDKFRIAIVGPSSVAGSINKIRYVSFCDYLQDLFDENHYSVEVVNCGVDGAHRIYELFMSVERDVLKIAPDLLLFSYCMPLYTNNMARECYGGVIMNYGKGDFQERGGQMKKIDKFNRQKPFLDLLYNSYIIRAAFKWYMNKKPFSATTATINIYHDISTYGKNISNGFSMSKTCQVFKELQHEMDQRGGKFFLFSLGYDPKMVRYCHNHGLPCISLSDVELTEEDVFYNDIHMNESGAAKVAENFYNIITKYDLIEPKYRLE